MKNTNIQPRKGCHDIWNAYMAEDVVFTDYDIPFCPTTATELPNALITWDEAKSIYKQSIRNNPDFIYDAFVCFYIDDYKFDGPRGIWYDANHTLKVLKHFAGTITPDFSTYQDFPEPIKIYATYRMRLFGYWLGQNGIKVINNVRWGSPETWKYCFNGIPKESIIAIGTVGGSPCQRKDRTRFEKGFREMLSQLQPKIIVVYGSSNYACFSSLNENIRIITFKSSTAKAFERRKKSE